MLTAALLAYLLGSLSPAYLVTRGRIRLDIRTLGSGNAGALNVIREVGLPWGLLVLLLDVAKGAGAVGIAHLLSGGATAHLFAAALGLLAGHSWPVILGFRGGRGAAPVLGISLAVLPGLTLVVLALPVAAFAVSRNAVFAIAVGFIGLNLLTIGTGQPSAQIALCFLLTSIVTVIHIYTFRHQFLTAYHARRWLDIFAME